MFVCEHAKQTKQNIFWPYVWKFHATYYSFSESTENHLLRILILPLLSDRLFTVPYFSVRSSRSSASYLDNLTENRGLWTVYSLNAGRVFSGIIVAFFQINNWKYHLLHAIRSDFNFNRANHSAVFICTRSGDSQKALIVHTFVDIRLRWNLHRRFHAR